MAIIKVNKLKKNKFTKIVPHFRQWRGPGDTTRLTLAPAMVFN